MRCECTFRPSVTYICFLLLLFVENLAFSDPELTTPDPRQLTRDEAYSESIRRHLAVWKKLKQLGIEDDYEKKAFFVYE